MPAVLTALLMPGLLAGCSGQESSAPEPEPTPLASLNAAAMEIPRIEFCPLVGDTAVEDALGSAPDSDTSYGNGDEVALPRTSGSGTREVVHEIGCTWSTDAGAAARAWLFARPVDAKFARSAIRSMRGVSGCKVGGGPAYGDPTVTQTCRPPTGSLRVRHAGLFGQTWLTCEVSGPPGDRDLPALRERTDQWCVDVVNALDTSG